jgi:hypothetical protein
VAVKPTHTFPLSRPATSIQGHHVALTQGNLPSVEPAPHALLAVLLSELQETHAAAVELPRGEYGVLGGHIVHPVTAVVFE